MKQIPNLFTLLNLFFGCVAIVFIMQYNPQGGLNLSGIGLMLGSLFIFLAAVIDFLDGFVARLFKATSAMGEQLDSLADVVSFGVAPGMLLFKMLELSFSNNPEISNPLWFQLPAFILPCAAAWRLAKFNLDKEQRYYFKGVPTPAVGLVIASLPLARVGNWNIEAFFKNPYIIYTIIILLSYLMVSNIPMMSLKFKSKAVKDNIDKILIVVIAVVAAIVFQWAAVPIVFVAYVLLSLFIRPDQSGSV
ncbi:MAG: CDP-diacylglycerol--serine O-phosphatidyltransferase [Sphingobacteriales bacterium 41-5]|nr:MAG: CDP-diacylglycerol--serine O-phosphatidyltransferase [Sphingobacteriales bacterium 41-5]